MPCGVVLVFRGSTWREFGIKSVDSGTLIWSLLVLDDRQYFRLTTLSLGVNPSLPLPFLE